MAGGAQTSSLLALIISAMCTSVGTCRPPRGHANLCRDTPN